MTIVLATVCAAALIGAAFDVRTRRIPNALAGALLLAGLVENFALSGWKGAGIAVAVAGVTLLLGSVAFSFKLIGGGDVKLLAAAAGTLGYPDAVSFFLYTLVCGGVLAIAYAAIRGRLHSTFSNVQAATLPMLAGGRPLLLHNGLTMPYALAILAGALCTAALSAAHLRIF